MKNYGGSVNTHYINQKKETHESRLVRIWSLRSDLHCPNQSLYTELGEITLGDQLECSADLWPVLIRAAPASPFTQSTNSFPYLVTQFQVANKEVGEGVSAILQDGALHECGYTVHVSKGIADFIIHMW
eukprot:1144025-Pelagomonas_calceolata.AAC.6